MLSDRDIRREMAEGDIVVRPLLPGALGSNSVDLHLGPVLGVYENGVLDAARPNAIRFITLPDTGYLLRPGTLYLGVTEEWTATSGRIVPWLDGKSSVGRLGISSHATAGRGDAGFAGRWTLEISVLRPAPRPWWAFLAPWWREGVLVYPGMPIAQLTYFRTESPVDVPYGDKAAAKYAGQSEWDPPRPVASKMYRNFDVGDVEGERRWR